MARVGGLNFSPSQVKYLFAPEAKHHAVKTEIEKLASKGGLDYGSIKVVDALWSADRLLAAL